MSEHFGFDSYSPVSGVLDRLPDEIDFVCRYYAWTPGKCLGLTEAQACAAMSLKMVSIWESDGQPKNAAQGTVHATEAVRQAKNLNQPADSAIYFAVDYDADEFDISGPIEAYMIAAGKIVRAAGYTLGLYGSGLVLSALNSVVDYRWLAASQGWRGTRLFDVSKASIVQYSPNTDPWGLGFQIDLDRTPGDDFGGWAPPAATV